MRIVVKILIWLVAVACTATAIHVLRPLSWWRIAVANLGFTTGAALTYALLTDFLERRKKHGKD